MEPPDEDEEEGVDIITRLMTITRRQTAFHDLSCTCNKRWILNISHPQQFKAQLKQLIPPHINLRGWRTCTWMATHFTWLYHPSSVSTSKNSSGKLHTTISSPPLTNASWPQWYTRASGAPQPVFTWTFFGIWSENTKKLFISRTFNNYTLSNDGHALSGGPGPNLRIKTHIFKGYF